MLLRSHLAVLLDFDGPICSVFAGDAAPDVAASLLHTPQSRAIFKFGDLPQTEDPLEVLRQAEEVGGGGAALRELDAALTRLEVQAVRSAEPTEGSHELITQLVQATTPTAIVSNNSAECVAAYFVRHGLPEVPIVGRPFGKPCMMKPHPSMLLEACLTLGAPPASAVMLGDSVTDVEASLQVGTLCIGYANSAGKAARLSVAGAHVVIESLLEVWPLLSTAAARRKP